MEKKTLELANGILMGERHSLAKSITLIESSNYSHMKQASLLLTYLSKNIIKSQRETIRIGIAGPPGY